MKKFLGLLLIIAMIALLAGCGGSSNPGGNNPGGNDPVKQLVIKWSSATPANSIAAKSVSPGPIEYPDGKDGKYIGGTAYVYQGTNWSRTVYLEAEFYQDGQRVNFTLEESNKVLWTCTQGVTLKGQLYDNTGYLVNFKPENVGKLTITATYNGVTASITVLVYKRIFMSDADGCITGVTFADYSYNYTDLKVVQDGDNFIVTAPGGIALVEKRASEYLDPTTRYNLALLNSVPADLTYSTSITISGEESGIYIVKAASGSGYAKVAFCNGLNGGGWLPGLVDTFIEYSPTDHFNSF